jgi:hypothetical protein
MISLQEVKINHILLSNISFEKKTGRLNKNSLENKNNFILKTTFPTASVLYIDKILKN